MAAYHEPRKGTGREGCHRELPHVIRIGSVAGRTEPDDYPCYLEEGI